MAGYDAKAIERKWQAVWAEERTWEVPNPGQPGFDESKPKSYVLEMLPYPSGEPHVGHLKCYAVGDAIAHFRRRHGYEVVHPMGYDAFGLPAENNAIKTGEPPREATERSIESFRRQFREWGISIDWAREIGTHTPEYYRWTQWIFLRFLERGLAYRTEAPVQWCPKDATVLANEQVVDGRCERCGTPVVQRKLEQWFFKITDYAERLLADFDRLESWPEHVITMQRNWIGRSEGAEVVFRCEEVGLDFPVFTTRPDTLFGATFFVLAPEHPELERLVAGTEAEEAVREYVDRVARESAEERGDEDREKTGVPLGRTVVNPVNGEEIPMFVADYVLMEYGTGAIMAVPAHDSRDYEFAKAFDLPVRRVIEGVDEETARDDEGLPYPGDGPMAGSGPLRRQGQPRGLRGDRRVARLRGPGQPAINYRLRDWLVSRQRYWGAPIPVVYCEACGEEGRRRSSRCRRTGSRSSCPRSTTTRRRAGARWRRPRTGSPPNARAAAGPLAARRTRWTPSSTPPGTSSATSTRATTERPWDRAAADHWLPVDQYIGGVEHAILHLMYARFFTKALADIGELEVQEPFANLFAQGMITRDGAKMSKSRGNTVAPSEYVERHGADTARTYVCFMGPPERGGDWTDEGVEGVGRFLARLWRLCEEVEERTEAGAGGSSESAEVRDLIAKAHWAIDKTTRDFERGFQFNTVIAAVMELVNDAYRVKDDLFEGADGQAALRFATATAASLIFPFAPHLGAEVWERLHGGRVWEEPWPKADPALLASDTVTLVVQVNGKLRDRIEVGVDTPEDELLALSAGERERQPPPRRQGDRQGGRRARQAGQSRGSLTFPGFAGDFC